ncbi:winged helix-turn-helix transcriptional regulator [Zhouia sp. PK063]|uniref:winged helix-turn-helix transcriptional regulator n=1 Tax=Zhouia sp. PK063 TaxID=3373602 RepID=UPI00378B929B
MFQLEEKVYPCSTSLAMRYIGGKWKSVILIHLVNGEMRYNELRKVIEVMTERALSLQLKQLEDDGLIIRKVHTDKAPLKVTYELTAFGKTLIPLLKSIAEWGRYAANHRQEINIVEDKCDW